MDSGVLYLVVLWLMALNNPLWLMAGALPLGFPEYSKRH
jgi:hypothetical protein